MHTSNTLVHIRKLLRENPTWTQKEVAFALGISEAAVSKQLSKVKSKVNSKVNSTSAMTSPAYIISSNTSSSSSSPKPEGSYPNVDSSKQYYKLHRLAIRYPLMEVLSSATILAKLSEAKLSSSPLSRRDSITRKFTYKDYGIRLSTSGLSIVPKPVFADTNTSNPYALEASTFARAHTVAMELQALLLLNLEQIEGRPVGYVKQEEFSITNNEIAKKVLESDRHFKILDPGTGKVRIIIDASPNPSALAESLDEVEGVMPEHEVQDVSRIREMLADVAYNEAWPAMKYAIAQNTDTTRELARQIEIHLPAVRALGENAGKSSEATQQLANQVTSLVNTVTSLTQTVERLQAERKQIKPSLIERLLNILNRR